MEGSCSQARATAAIMATATTAQMDALQSIFSSATETSTAGISTQREHRQQNRFFCDHRECSGMGNNRQRRTYVRFGNLFQHVKRQHNGAWTPHMQSLWPVRILLHQARSQQRQSACHQRQADRAVSSTASSGESWRHWLTAELDQVQAQDVARLTPGLIAHIGKPGLRRLVWECVCRPMQVAVRPDLHPQIRARAAKMVMMMPVLLLRKDKGVSCNKSIRRHCAKFMEGTWQELWECAQQDGHHHQYTPQQEQDAGHTIEQQQRRAKRAMKHIARNELSKARRVLMGSPPIPMNEQVMQQLIELHPTEDDVMLQQWTQQVRATPVQTLPRTAVAHAINSAPFGSAPGPGGWRYRLIQQMFNAGHDQLLVAFIQACADGSCIWEDLQARELLTGAFLVPFCKPGSGALRVRPVAIASTWRRLVGKAWLYHERQRISELLEEVGQHAMSKGGCEKVAHKIRTWRQEEPGDEPRVIISFDCKNAFNCVRRQAIVTAVNLFLPHLKHWTALTYGSHSQLWLPNGECIPSQSGSQQGDTLGGLLFCVATMQCLQRVLLQIPSARAAHFADDLNFSIPVKEASRLCTTVQQNLQQVGLTICWRKTTVLVGSQQIMTRLQSEPTVNLVDGQSGCLEDGPQYALAVGDGGCAQIVVEEDGGGVVICGIPHGASEFQERHLLSNVHARTQAQRDAMRSVSHLQSRWRLVSMCLAPRVIFWLRCLPPSVTTELQMAHDNLLHDEVSELCGGHAPLNKISKWLSSMPMEAGGLGLSSAQDLAPIAFVTAWMSTLAAIPDQKRVEAEVMASSADGREAQQLAQLVLCDGRIPLSDLDNIPNLQDGWRTFWRTQQTTRASRVPNQRRWGAALGKWKQMQFADVVSRWAASPEETVRHMACNKAHTSVAPTLPATAAGTLSGETCLVLRCIPDRIQLRVCNTDFTDMLRYRLCMEHELARCLPQRCQFDLSDGNKCGCILDPYGDHVRTARHAKMGQSRTEMHNGLVVVLQDILRSAGHMTRREVCYSAQRTRFVGRLRRRVTVPMELRMDLVDLQPGAAVRTAGAIAWMDLTTASPFSRSALAPEVVANPSKSASELAAASKHRKYDEAASMFGAEVVPIAVSFGGRMAASTFLALRSLFTLARKEGQQQEYNTIVHGNLPLAKFMVAFACAEARFVRSRLFAAMRCQVKFGSDCARDSLISVVPRTTSQTGTSDITTVAAVHPFTCSGTTWRGTVSRSMSATARATWTGQPSWRRTSLQRQMLDENWRNPSRRRQRNTLVRMFGRAKRVARE